VRALGQLNSGILDNAIRLRRCGGSTVVAQFVGGACRRRARRVVDARDGAQIFVYCLEVAVAHVRKRGPGHDLQKVTVRDIVVALARTRTENDGSSGNANWRATILNFCQLICRTGGMDVVEIRAMPHDLLKLCKRVTAFGPPILVRRQISGDDEWASIPPRPGRRPDCAEVGITLPEDVCGPVDFFALLRLASIFRGEDPFEGIVSVCVDSALLVSEVFDSA